MPTPSVHIKLDFAALQNALIREFRRLTQRLLIALDGSDRIPKDHPIRWPVFFGAYFDAESAYRMTAEVRADFKRWAIGVGLTEAIGALEQFLIELGYLVELQSKRRLTAKRDCTLQEFFSDLRSELTREFAQGGWPVRIERLRARYDFEVRFAAELLSINQVRNCLVHRRGVVGMRDINDHNNQELALKYRAAELVESAPNGEERIVVAGDVVKAGHELQLRHGVEREKRFGRATCIAFEAQEFTHLLMTLYSFGMALVDEAVKRGKKLGIPDAARTDPA